MITKYLTSLQVQFAPLSHSKAHRMSRLLLSFLPSNATAPVPSGLGMKVSKTILSSSSAEPARVVIGLKGGDQVIFQEYRADPTVEKTAAAAPPSGSSGTGKPNTFDLAKMSIQDITDELDRRSRKIGRAEELS